MEKSLLTSYEYKCIQDQPAYCVAACPFSVDVKTFMGFMISKDFDKAFGVLEKTMPLPEITSRVCDHPCEKECIRNEIDQPLGIGNLEKICAGLRSKRKKRFLPPKNGKKIGIWGSGLSSLVAAFDLLLKGYSVDIHEGSDKPGGYLLNISQNVVSLEVLNYEIDELVKMGAVLKLSSTIKNLITHEGIKGYNAVYIGFDSDVDDFSFMKGEDGKPSVNSFLQTDNPLIFAGGFGMEIPKNNSLSYPVMYAFHGRKAASSLDRVVSNVSISAGREKEGINKTRLSTDISLVEKNERIEFLYFEGGKALIDIEKASMEASRCIMCDCSRCLRVCEYLRAFKAYPGKYAREIYNNISIVMGEKKGNLLTNSCSLCGLCEEVCPNDFSMADLCLTAREELFETGKMPQSAHEFALMEMEWALGENCFFARHIKGEERSDKLFFPGCQLTASSPSLVEKVYDFLMKISSEKIGFVSGCCCAPAKWAGRNDLFKKSSEKIKNFWEEKGKPEIITACPSCTLMLSEILEGVRIKSLYTYILEYSDTINFSDNLKGQLSESVNIIDPCTARNDDGIKRDVRDIVEKAGVRIEELPASGDLTECCGFGGLVFNANPKLSRDIIKLRSKQSCDDFIAYCSMCRDRIASTDKRCFHLLELIFPDKNEIEFRKDPGFSVRHENLALFKREMLRKLWGETIDSKDSFKELIIKDEVKKLLEDQFILTSDINKVLTGYERDGEFFVNPERKSTIATLRPKNVRFWVEFTENNGKYEVLDAWCHRMKVTENKEFEPDKPTPESDVNILCGKCNEKLMPSKNKVEYLKSRFDVTLPQCEKCFDIYISPETARGRMAEVEKILEDK